MVPMTDYTRPDADLSNIRPCDILGSREIIVYRGITPLRRTAMLSGLRVEEHPGEGPRTRPGATTKTGGLPMSGLQPPLRRTGLHRRYGRLSVGSQPVTLAGESRCPPVRSPGSVGACRTRPSKRPDHAAILGQREVDAASAVGAEGPVDHTGKSGRDRPGCG